MLTKKFHIKYYYFLLILLFFYGGDQKTPAKYIWKELTVKVTAYNSLAYQTSPNPEIAAWGDSLKPGMKCIAVSRDLIKLGLTRNTPVKLHGFEGIFLVKDKMHGRKKNQIDIYMGVDKKKAKRWGVKHLKIQYAVLNDALSPN